MCDRKYRSILVLLTLVALSLSAVWADTTTGLVSHWKLDDGSGTVATDSVGGNDGILQGDATWAEGFLGGALLLDGTGDYVDCGSKPAFNITDAVTLTAWVQARGDFAYPDWSGIIMRGGPNIDTFAFYYNGPSQQLGFKTTGCTPEWYATGANTATALFDGDWHHVAATYDGKVKVVYLDAVVVGTVATTGKIETSNGRLFLGAGRDLNPTTHHLCGRIDDARLYKRGLSAADIKELVPPKVQARKPEPANGTMGVTTPLFRWTAGETAVLHNVYIGKTPDLGPADLAGNRQPLAMFWYVPGLEPGVTYYWRVDEIEANGTTIHTGNVWTFTTQALTAYQPSPVDGTKDASPVPTLTWQPGQAATKHHVYLGDTLDAVQQRAAGTDKGEVADATFSPGALAGATTYFWAVDELIAGGATKAGPVWTFTTYLPVDDFESYTDAAGSRIYETWADGLTNGTGSLVGYMTSPFAERTIVHGGQQSMPLDYNNIKSPFYSEAEQEFAAAQDWTVGEVSTLVLFVRGKLDNGPAPLYLTVKDTSNKTATVLHPDATVIGAAKWTEWRIPLASLAGVNLAKIKKIIIGLGDKANPKTGGAGLIYIDDIRVSR
ncbi:MAG: LamG domain-containing protein [Planctomycetes bacterium]|nr:LamG domain-containing protein [Planctomycetota bacterium]